MFGCIAERLTSRESNLVNALKAEAARDSKIRYCTTRQCDVSRVILIASFESLAHNISWEYTQVRRRVNGIAPDGAKMAHPRGAISSVGRAPALHAGCRRFEPVIAHHAYPPAVNEMTQILNDNVPTERLAPGVIALTLNRPDRRNALSRQLMRALDATLEHCASDRSIRVVILRADGPAFSAGHDLRELACADTDANRETFDDCVRLMERIIALPQPVIAQVDGVATAAGCQLVATCDLAVASERATFATPGVRIGLFCSTPMVALSRAIGRKRAMEMLLTGEAISAQTALEWGLINRVVASEHLAVETLALATRIALSSPAVVALGKRAFYEQIECERATAYASMADTMMQNLEMKAAAEGIDAFLTKRAAVWPE